MAVTVEHPILIEDYQRKRIVDFIEGNKSEEVDMTDAGTYQQAYAVQAIGSGQLYGKGLNNNDTSSLKNAGYIAEAQNDFIFAVIGEELGFTGSCITIFLLFLIVLECIITAVIPQLKKGNGTPVLGSIHETTPILINV